MTTSLVVTPVAGVAVLVSDRPARVLGVTTAPADVFTGLFALSSPLSVAVLMIDPASTSAWRAGGRGERGAGGGRCWAEGGCGAMKL